MVEVVPRPRKANLFVQVSVAVISGAAAMYCIQNFHPDANAPASAVRKKVSATGGNNSRPPLPAKTVAPPVAVAPDPGAETSRFKAAPPAPVSMMVMPEPGGASDGVVSIGADAPVPDVANPPPVKKRWPTAVPAAREMPSIHLRQSNLQSLYAGQIGHGFQSSQLAPHVFPKKETPKVEPASQEVSPKPAPHFIVYPRDFGDKGVPQKDIFVPSTLHPEVVQETPFWDFERKRKALVAGLISLSGVFYLMSVMGFLNAFVIKRRFDDESKP